MNLKRIGILVVLLLGLLLMIRLVDRHESGNGEDQARLLDLNPEQVDRVELVRGLEKIVLLKQQEGWVLDHHRGYRADGGAVRDILDDFCRLKIDRQVESQAESLGKYGLDSPEIELRLFENRDVKTVHTIQIGIRNELDSTSYARLDSDSRVVLIASYLRDQLDKGVFDFRDKIVFPFESGEVRELEIVTRKARFLLKKSDPGWFLKRPIFSLAADSVVSTILAATSGLEAIAFWHPDKSGQPPVSGFDRPALELKLKVGEETRVLKAVRQNERIFVRTTDRSDICEIDKAFLRLFDKGASDFREYKIARFYGFDVTDIIYRVRGISCRFRRDSDHNWTWVEPSGMGELDGDRINDLLSELANLEASGFMDQPTGNEVIPHFLELKSEEKNGKGESLNIGLWISEPSGNVVLVKNRDLPYLFRVSRKFFDSLPNKIEDFIKKSE